ncbi:MAG: hypothetical protein V3V20_10530 [Algisphaera sp.]
MIEDARCNASSIHADTDAFSVTPNAAATWATVSNQNRNRSQF